MPIAARLRVLSSTLQVLKAIESVVQHSSGREGDRIAHLLSVNADCCAGKSVVQHSSGCEGDQIAHVLSVNADCCGGGE